MERQQEREYVIGEGHFAILSCNAPLRLKGAAK